ncbi:MAG: hypothetical protein LBC71_01720 [Oscillospiraceae bacterium]|jgi:hypothetical protein|nr:hypothetical protein [Oscillospiraceae bacterium]
MKKEKRKMNNVPKTQKTVHLSHLLAKDLGGSVNQELIINALFDISSTVGIDDLQTRVKRLFGVDIPNNIMESELRALQDSGIVNKDGVNNVLLSDLTKAEISKLSSEETSISEAAFNVWISSEYFEEVMDNERDALKNTIEPFLDKIFVTHGASCIKLLIQDADITEFDINIIAGEVAEMCTNEQSFLKAKLPTIFTMSKSVEVLRYLEQRMSKAIKYLSTVMPANIRDSLRLRLKGVIIYLDTSFLYRLLDLQGESRYLSAKETIEFCINAGVTLRVTAETYKELLRSIENDAKILNKYPVKTNLFRLGYNFRSDDNYISTFWRKAESSNITTKIFNETYANPSIILNQQYGINIEENIEESKAFIYIAGEFYSKINSQRGRYDKTDLAAWHDAYCLATVRRLQLPNAKNAIDSKCLLLTTDQQIITLQEEDNSLKNQIPIALTPSQLLQIFSFSTSVGDYVETFVKLFSTATIKKSDLGFSNAEIHEILGRLSHYEYLKPEVVESILEDQLFREGYNPQANETEKEEIIYNAISQELLSNLESEKDENIKLWKSKKELEDTISRNNEETFKILNEKNRIEGIVDNQRKDIDTLISKSANRKYSWWRFGHIICLILGGVFTILGIIVIIIIMVRHLIDQADMIPIVQTLGSISVAGLGIPLFKFGFKIVSPNQRSIIIEKYEAAIRNELSGKFNS